MDDKNFNEFLPLGLGFFDAVILAQSCTVGILLTEDSRLLHLKDIGVKIYSGEFRVLLACANLELLATYPKGDSQILCPFNVEHSFNVIRQHFYCEFSPL
ncbi:hypothetical protein CW713_10155 [Methanophagales archaeon]|nr:MAG: hypothetical protein CW713_10155 [Methanophagales archaeon]